jgi:hypothetical protein
MSRKGLVSAVLRFKRCKAVRAAVTGEMSVPISAFVLLVQESLLRKVT